MEFGILKVALNNALSKRGNQPSTHSPRLIFLIGYATEIGVDAPYENFIVLLGYDSTTARPVYQARVKVNSRTPRIEQIGTLVIEALVSDLAKAGSNVKPLGLRLGDL